ncbi:acyl-CoA dehydrogenase [Pseudotenacibaculum haliotis]|uniref:Acyl-CoA dehydrogenase n=1 Tax=Pseudotenacibaculum haliotis TaxID=1862138 RepID=A0ABW5LX15_9FLAO
MPQKYVDVDTLKYMLYDVHNLEGLLNRERFQDHDKESLDMFLESVKEFADREMFPYFKEMDEQPAYHKDGKVFVHNQVKTMMHKGGELGLISAPFDYDDGGLQIPLMTQTAAYYILDAANNHLPGYAALTQGAAELIVHFADEKLKETYVSKMLSGIWGGTMCLTEPQAGSSLSDVITKAIPTEEGYYHISGQKIFISGGDNDFAENVVHMVLARIEGAPKGTKGISLFVVPKNRLKQDGTLEWNDVTTVADFQKLGQKGYCTTHLGFGDKEDCRGWLVGEPNKGLHYMFMMMNAARIAVGRGASAIASAAYYASLEYANERPQGRKLSSDGKKNPDEKQTLIINHPDVRRMLLQQKSIVEGTMSLTLLAANYYDRTATATSPEEKEKYHQLLEMIIPIVKTYPSEAGIQAVNAGLQTLGGYGFCEDYILQQYYRDIRIFSIYEGTTGIQSQDLLGRKVPMKNGKVLELLSGEILKTIQEASAFEELKTHAQVLGGKLQLTQKVLGHLLPHAMQGNYERYLADASVFMEFMSLILMGWMWLDLGTHATRSLQEGGDYSHEFYNSKIHTMKYFYTYELPKTTGLSEILLNTESLTIKKDTEPII